jgi:DNA polymerase-3 subunit epsilon
MREIVLDTETTGLDVNAGDRLVEIAGLELVNHVATGRSYHRHINPQRAMPTEAFAVHGLSDEFLADKPVFAEIAASFLDFIADSRLVIHNAAFDLAFLNHEFARAEGHSCVVIAPDRVIDTLDLARRRHPFGPNSLDALCRRYNIDNSRRTLHGALLDCELLAEVYLELIGGRQPVLGLDREHTQSAGDGVRLPAAQRPLPLPPRLSAADAAAHAAFVETLGPDALWRRFGVGGPVPAGENRA